MRKLFIPIITFILAATLFGCNSDSKHKSTVPSDAEEEMFMLVFEPNYEGRHDDAVSVADSLLSNCQMSDSLKAFIMIERDVALINMGRSDDGFRFADTLITFGKETGINEAVLQGLTAKGLIYRRNGEQDSAISNYSEALSIAIADKNIEWEQAITEYLAIAYTEGNRLEEGHQFIIRALDLAKEMGDTAAILQSVGTLAGNLAKSKDYTNTIKELRSYEDLFNTAPPTFRIKYLTPLFHSYLSLDSLDKAEKILSEAEDISNLFPHEHYQWIIVRLLRAKLYHAQKRYAAEYAIYQEVDTIGHGTIGRQLEDMMLEKAKCLACLGRSEEAFGMMEMAYSALDSTRNSQLQKDLSDLSVKYDTLTKQIEIERLGRQRWIMIYVITICIVLLAALVFLFIYYRSRSRRRLAQERKEQYLSGLEEERSRMARELHDDIAGQLTGLQWEIPNMSQEETSRRIMAIGQRVRTMSHEMMPPQFATQTLCQLLIDFTGNFNTTHKSPRIAITDEGAYDWNRLSVRESYVLYRIVQESVNNALKHADATEIKITLDGDERFKLTIENDGAKASEENISSGAGTNTLRTRAEIIGCNLSASCTDGIYTLTIGQK